MSLYPNVTKWDLNKSDKVAEQQKNQRAPKIKNRILEQTHGIKLAEPLSPLTKKVTEVKESNQNSGEVTKENNNPQLAIEKLKSNKLEKTNKYNLV